MIATPKLIGMIVAILAGVALAIVGAALQDETLKVAGVGMASSAAGILYGNGKSAAAGQTSAPAILPSNRATDE